MGCGVCLAMRIFTLRDCFGEGLFKDVSSVSFCKNDFGIHRYSVSEPCIEISVLITIVI